MKRLYAQLKPSEATLATLLASMQLVPGRGRFVTAEQLHLTIIHFGIIDEVVRTLPTERAFAQNAVDRYIARSEAILRSYSQQRFHLEPTGVEKFGEYKKTLVVTYASSPILDSLHEILLSHLKSFLRECQVEQVEDYMARDPNFKHALRMQPHITIAKGYEGNLPKLALEPAELSVMKFVY